MNGEHNVLQPGILRVYVMGIVGGNIFKIIVFTQIEQGAVQFRQLADGVILKFDEEIVGSKSFQVPFKNLLTGLYPFVEDGTRYLTGHA